MAQPRARERPAPGAPPPDKKRPWWLISLGAAAVLLIALATLPATLMASQLSRAGLDAAGLWGSVWNGRAQGLTWKSAPLGDLQWTLSPWQLLLGRAAGEVTLGRPDGSLRAAYRLALDGTLRLEDVQADLPVEMLSSLPIGMPRNWRGRLSGRFDEVTLRNGWPQMLRGTLDMDGLIAPPPRNTSIGSYHVVIPDPAPAGEAAPDSLTARVTDKEGPFSFEGRFTLGADRSFLLEGTLAPRGTTPPALVRSLDLLGPADANGRRPVSVSGTL
jgi:general secretion pathway protein N